MGFRQKGLVAMPLPADQSHWPHGDLHKLRHHISLGNDFQLFLLCLYSGMEEECTPHAGEYTTEGRRSRTASSAFPLWGEKG